MTVWLPKEPHLSAPKKIPGGLVKYVKANCPARLHKRALALAKVFYFHGFKDVITPIEARLRHGWRLNGRDSSYLIKTFMESGAVRRVGHADRRHRLASVYTANESWLKEIYTNSDIVYPDIERALSGRYKPHHVVKTGDAELSNVLHYVDFYWNNAAAIDKYMTLPPERRAAKWQSVCLLPGGEHQHCSWRQADWSATDGGRLYTFDNNWQGVPKELRVDGVYCPPGAHVIEVDFTAQHANLCLVHNGIEPSAELWNTLREKTELPKYILKRAIVPLLSTQGASGYIYHCREDYNDFRPALELIQEREAAIKAFLSMLPRGANSRTITAIDYMKQGARIMHEILKSAARQGMYCIALHDGIIYRGSESERPALLSIFKQASAYVLGVPLPAR